MKSIFEIRKTLLLFFLFCTSLFFSPLAVAGIGGYSGSNSGWSQAAEDGAARREGPLCKTAKLSAVEATTGMDVSSYMLVANASQGVATATADDKKSAKTAHQIAGGVHTALGAVATKKYIDCSSAIGVCETQCAPGTCPEAATAPLPEKPAAEILCEESLAECVALNGPCNAAIAQALASGLLAATSFIAANTLDDDGDGGDPDPIPDPDPDDPPPNPSSPDNPSNGGLHAADITGGASSSNPEGMSGPSYIPTTKNSPENKNENRNPGSTTPGSNGDTDSSNTPEAKLAALAGGSSPSSGFRMDSSPGKDDEETEEARNRRYSSDSTAGFAGGASSSRGNSRRPPHNSAGGGKKLKLALNKKEEKKRDVFGKAGPHDSIFVHMSRVIQSYCAEGGKCHIKDDQAK